jgi:segregation and condensation protein B
MTTPHPPSPEDRPEGPAGPAGPAGPVLAVPGVGPSGSGLTSGSGAVAARDSQSKLEVEAGAGSGAGSDLEGGGASAAGEDVEGAGRSAAGSDVGGASGAAAGVDIQADGGSAGPAAEGFEGDPTAWPPDEAFEAVELDDRGWTRRDLEAILLVADEPVPAAVLAEIVGARLSEVEELLIDLAGEYARDGRGFVLRAIGGGWRLYTSPGARAAVEAYLRAGQQSRLTRAALETLAVIAYRQPVTRFQVAAVRGVNVDGVFRTLASRGLIHEVGTDPGPGQATLYGTTPAFLEQLGLNSLDQLPPIKDYLPEGVDLLDLQERP